MFKFYYCLLFVSGIFVSCVKEECITCENTVSMAPVAPTVTLCETDFTHKNAYLDSLAYYQNHSSWSCE